MIHRTERIDKSYELEMIAIGVFAYIGMMRKEGPKEWIAREVLLRRITVQYSTV